MWQVTERGPVRKPVRVPGNIIGDTSPQESNMGCTFSKCSSEYLIVACSVNFTIK